MPTPSVLRSRRATSMACHIVSALPPVPNLLSPPTHRPHAPQNSDFSNATTKVCARPLATTWLPRSHRAIRTLWQREHGQRQAREDAPQAAWRQPAGARVVSSQPQLSREPCAVRGLVIQGIGGLVSPLVRVSYSADAACRCRLPAHRRPRRRPRRRVSPPSLALKGGV